MAYSFFGNQNWGVDHDDAFKPSSARGELNQHFALRQHLSDAASTIRPKDTSHSLFHAPLGSGCRFSQDHNGTASPTAHTTGPGEFHHVPPCAAGPGVQSNRTLVDLSPAAGPQTTDTHDHGLRHSRKKSSLRGALGKLFGRKKDPTDRDVTTVQVKSRRNTVTSAYGRPSSHTYTARSHPSSDLPGRNEPSLILEDTDSPVRTRELLVSPSLSYADVQGLTGLKASTNAYNKTTFPRSLVGVPQPSLFDISEGELSGLSPRPVSAHGRSSSVPLSSPADARGHVRHGSVSQLGSRRGLSRSLSRLHLSPDESLTARRRSEEIRFWRDSYARSPMSSEPPELDEEGGCHDVTSAPSPSSPLRPFAFGSMSEISGMKITLAASMESRIEQLEKRMKRMESQATRASGSVMPALSVMQPGSDVKTDSLAKTFYNTSPPSSRGSSKSKMGGSSVTAAERPLSTPVSLRSTARIRRDENDPDVVQKDPTVTLPLSQYTSLVEMMDAERASREALESQVRKLSRYVKTLSRVSVISRASTPLCTAHSEGPEAATFYQDGVVEAGDSSSTDALHDQSTKVLQSWGQ